MSKLISNLLILLAFANLPGCRSASSGSHLPIAVGTLIEEYQNSRTHLRSKYDGQEITIRGYARSDPALPRDGSGQGSVTLAEKDMKAALAVTCWFTSEQVAEFSKVQGDEFITVRGVFTGEAGAELKFCKLVKGE